MLEIKELVKDFSGVRALDRCSLGVEVGSITGLIGPNGAGKTTLFNLVTGFHRLDEGEIRFKGEGIGRLPTHKIFARGLTRTFQIPREIKGMTVLENLMLVAKEQLGESFWASWLQPRSVRAQEGEIRDRSLEVLEFVSLIDLRNEYAENLSAGQKKLLELARALMGDPEMILLDEPGAGVNPALMNKLVDYISELQARGVTFLLIEHDMDLVMNLCNPVIVMDYGRKLAEGAPEEIKKDERVIEAYLGGGHGE